MYTMSHPVSTSLNGGGMAMGNSIDPGTINPATLNPQMLSSGSANSASQTSPRGVKRSRSPDLQGDAAYALVEEDQKPRKRGRPPKVRVGESPRPVISASTPRTGGSMQSVAPPVQTPQLGHQMLPQTSPPAASPPKSTPTKSTVIKALPTVRDHTTDQLNPERDEFIPREIDEAGEKKVAANGAPLEGREYVCRTFFLPNRGDKLFMLATECARNLNYRDSYLLFNKNRSLFKIIATQPEKDHLIQQEVLPYSYRSRQIAIVTARSMYRQFGSRLIAHGRKVRDDYWESKARKQGFTEDDLAGEKRPGGAKKREAAAAEAGHTHTLTALPHGEITYSNDPSHLEGPAGMGALPSSSLGSLPMIQPSSEDMLQRDYGNVARPRQEMTGQPYQDHSQVSTPAEILNQAAQTAEFNRPFDQQRRSRGGYIKEYWQRPHEAPTPQRPGTAEGDTDPVPGQSLQSPPMGTSGPMMNSVQQSAMPPHGQPPLMHQPGYAPPSHAQNPMQSPMRPVHQPQPMQQRPPGMMPPGGVPGQQHPYGYPQNQMFHQPQPSPLSQSHPSIPPYAQQPPQQSPHPQPSPMHAPQMHPQSGGMQGQTMGYQGMGGMPGAPMSRNVYGPAQSPSPQHFIPQSSPGQQPGMQGWNQGQPHQMQPWQGGF